MDVGSTATAKDVQPSLSEASTNGHNGHERRLVLLPPPSPLAPPPRRRMMPWHVPGVLMTSVLAASQITLDTSNTLTFGGILATIGIFYLGWRKLKPEKALIEAQRQQLLDEHDKLAASRTEMVSAASSDAVEAARGMMAEMREQVADAQAIAAKAQAAMVTAQAALATSQAALAEERATARKERHDLQNDIWQRDLEIERLGKEVISLRGELDTLRKQLGITDRRQENRRAGDG